MTVKLTNTYINSVKPKEKLYRIKDYITGLYLRVMPAGAMYWDLRYISPITKKRNFHVIGLYKKSESSPTVTSIAQARIQAERIYANLNTGIDPNITQADMLFSTLYEEWRLKRDKEDLNRKHLNAMHSATVRFILPHIGNIEVAEIKPYMIADALREIEAKGRLDTLGKVKSNLNLVFSDFVVRGYIHENTSEQVPRSAFARKESVPQRHLTLDQIHLLHNYLRNEEANELIRLAVEFIARTGLRASEACQAKWEEYDEQYNVLSIYKGRMKNRKEHLVPLSSQAIKIIERLKELGTNKSQFIFFDPTSKTKHLNVEAPRNSLDNYNVPTSAHGLRHLFSTLLNEVMTFPNDLIESCLSHSPKDIIRATYNKANLVMPMREVFQEYSDHLDKCKTEQSNLQWISDNNIILLNGR